MSSTQKIGLTTAIIVGMNAMIGSGIFTLPSLLAAQAGPAGIITTVFVAILAWCLALSLAKVAKLFPMEGSFYNYSKQWGGHTLGVLANCAYLIGLCIAMALLAKGAGAELHYHFPSLSAHAFGIITLSVLVILNMLGVAISEIGQYILIICTVFPLLLTSVLCLTKANVQNLHPFAPFGFSSVFSTSKFVIFAFFGFESAASLFSIVENPEKNVPKALSYSLFIVAAIYILFASSLILALPMDQLAQAGTVTQALATLFPTSRWMVTIISLSILSAIIGTIHSMIWGSSRLLVSLIKVLNNKCTKNLIQKGIINETTAVLFLGIFIFLGYMLLQKAVLFYSLTALFIVFAFSTSIITILKLHHGTTKKDKFIAIIGLMAAGLILFYSVSAIIAELLK